MGAGYALPMTSKCSIEMTEWNGECVAVTMQGRRDSDEDAALLPAPIRNFPNCRVTGVFDGHNGKNTSIHCVRRIAHFLGDCESLSSKEIENACIKLDREIRSTKYKDEGSTGIFVIIEKLEKAGDFRLRICNVGDSRCSLLRANGTYVQLSFDHKPSLPKEKQRIEAANGDVTMDRVMGNMAVSRAFGDAWYKGNEDLPEDAQLMTCIPDVQEARACAGDVILLACDGIYEQLNWDEVATFTRQSLESYSLHETSLRLMDHSLVMGSLDNMTVLLVRLTADEFQAPQVSYHYLPGILFGGRHEASDQKKYFIEDLKRVGISFEDIQRTLAECPTCGEKEAFSPSLLLDGLLAEQRKMKRIKIGAFNKQSNSNKNKDDEPLLHYIPFDAVRIEKLGGSVDTQSALSDGLSEISQSEEEIDERGGKRTGGRNWAERKDQWYSDSEDINSDSSNYNSNSNNACPAYDNNSNNSNYNKTNLGGKKECDSCEGGGDGRGKDEATVIKGNDNDNDNEANFKYNFDDRQEMAVGLTCGLGGKEENNEGLGNSAAGAFFTNLLSCKSNAEKFEEKEKEEEIFYDAVETKNDLKNLHKVSVPQ